MNSELPRGVQERIGVPKVRECEVTDREIIRFAQAVGEELEQSSDGRWIAPVLFCQALMFEEVPVHQLPPDGSPKELDVPIPAQRAVGGGSEFEIFNRIYSGDRIQVTSLLKDVVIKEGKTGPLYLIQVETEFINQERCLVARENAVYIKKI